MRRLCGWASPGELPGEPTFSRAFAAFAAHELPQQIHAHLIKTHVGPKFAGHLRRDATAIETPARPVASADKSAKTDAQLAQWGMTNNVQEKSARSRPLTKLPQELHRLKSQIRCRIEPIFGWVENSMGGPELA